MPQPIADQFGWPEMVREVAAIYNSLPPDERAKTGIWAGNYGEAGAINEFSVGVDRMQRNFDPMRKWNHGREVN